MFRHYRSDVRQAESEKMTGSVAQGIGPDETKNKWNVTERDKSEKN